jgi:hypothetical protein
MMRGSSLREIRARVDRLAISVGAAGCGESHVRFHMSDVMNDDPEPDWPPFDSPTHCVCGAELTYRHFVNVYIEGPSLQNGGEISEHDLRKGRRFSRGAASHDPALFRRD